VATMIHSAANSIDTYRYRVTSPFPNSGRLGVNRVTNVIDGVRYSTPPVAAFDLGSNSIKMTVAAISADNELVELLARSETVRLGQGINTSGTLSQDRMDAALNTLSRFADEAKSIGATKLIGVATEAVRVAANGAAFLDRVLAATGIEFEVISGDREAELTFRGLAGVVDLSGQVVIADIGGASTELILSQDGAMTWERSFPIGSGRLTDDHVTSDPPTMRELEACRETARAATSSAPFGTVTGGRLVIVGGTGEYLDRLLPHEIERSEAALDAVLARFAAEPSIDISEYLAIPLSRARVLPAGVAIARGIADQMKPTSFAAAISGIRRGMLLAALDRSNQDG
jgi:exopolyphosphatase/pppGpp-phosphohydrolase